MKPIRVAMVAALAAVIASGCGDDNGSGPPPASLSLPDLVGTWEATSLVATNVADPSETVDLVGVGGSVNAKFESDGRFAFVTTIRGETEASTGSITVGDGSISVAEDGTQSSETFACGLSEERLTMAYGEESYDFDGDGTDETARITMVLARCMDEFPIAELSGDWEATRWEYRNDDDPSETVDVISHLYTKSLTIDVQGHYTRTIQPFDHPVETTEGTLLMVGAHLMEVGADDPANPIVLGCEMTIVTMILTQPNATYDFDGDGVEEDATVTTEWARI